MIKQKNAKQIAIMGCIICFLMPSKLFSDFSDIFLLISTPTPGFSYSFYDKSKIHRLSIKIGLNGEAPVYNNIEYKKINFAPGIILTENKQPNFFLDFQFMEYRNIFMKSIYATRKGFGDVSGLETTSYAFLQAGFKLVDIKNYDPISFKSNWLSLFADIIYDKRTWCCCLGENEINPDFSLQLKFSPFLGLSSIRFGDPYKKFGKISSETAFGLDLGLNSLVGLLIYNKLLLSLNLNYNPYLSNKGNYINEEISGNVSYNNKTQRDANRLDLGYTLFVDFSFFNISNSGIKILDKRISIGIKLYDFKSTDRWLLH